MCGLNVSVCVWSGYCLCVVLLLFVGVVLLLFVGVVLLMGGVNVDGCG